MIELEMLRRNGMKHLDRILDFVMRFPGKDDDEISQALEIEPRQTVNVNCRRLEAAGLIARKPGPIGKIANYPTSKQKSPIAVREMVQPEAARPAMAAPSDWFWEGSVVDRLELFLIDAGWSVLSKADTASKQQGIDLHVRRDEREMLIEAKGYPSSSYRDPNRSHEAKRTNPTVQAQHWYAHAVFKALRLKGTKPGTTVALALPHFPRYRALFDEIHGSLRQLGIVSFFVHESGAVDVIDLD